MLYDIDTCMFVGYLPFNEDDLQHAAYWCKDKSNEDRSAILNKFQEVWKYLLLLKCNWHDYTYF